MCSGSDLVMTVLAVLETMANEREHIQLKVVHKFSCENHQTKQSWIKRWFSPEQLFEDVMALGQDHCTQFVYDIL